jgi:hypothetical protein
MSAEIDFPTKEVVAAACAIFNAQGFIKRDSFQNVEEGEKPKLPNSTILYNHFLNNEKVELSDEDYALADTIIDYLRGLSFKAFERTLTDFETNVLKFVGIERVGKDKLGIAASLPNVYNRKLEADRWASREAELAENSQYVGTLNKRSDFVLKVEHVREISSTMSFLFTCSESNNNIVKFFNTGRIAQPGDDLTITAYVKSHAVSKYSGGKETMINRIKVA